MILKMKPEELYMDKLTGTGKCILLAIPGL